jgi:antitoxin VapB
VGLNIKNERVHELARQAARMTGKSQTAAIQEALERFIADGGPDPEAARQQRLDVLWQEIQVGTTDADRAATRQAMEELYDEAGLPR